MFQGTTKRWWNVSVEEWAARARVFHVAECNSFRVDSFKTPTVLNLFVCVPLRASHPHLYVFSGSFVPSSKFGSFYLCCTKCERSPASQFSSNNPSRVAPLWSSSISSLKAAFAVYMWSFTSFTAVSICMCVQTHVVRGNGTLK